MYSTCITCHAPLGANDMIERFPVGRKIAIDASRGRLWAICRVCKQWNLSPIEERWEAIEDGERLFRDARLRTSTDNIGLARLKDGTELIRVGEPQRPEFAAWRYGDRFAQRWVIRGPAAAVGGGVLTLTKGIGFFGMMQIAAAPLVAIAGAKVILGLVHKTRKVLELQDDDGARFRFTQEHVETMRILRDPDDESGWHLRVRHTPVGSTKRRFSAEDPELIVHGGAALRLATRLLPRINRVGGRRKTVAEAVNFLERAGSADAVFRLASRLDPDSRRTMRREAPSSKNRSFFENEEDQTSASSFARADARVRLAVEMAAHEEQERAALAGELEDLEAQWKEAEEIASIADGLTFSPALVAKLDRLRLR